MATKNTRPAPAPAAEPATQADPPPAAADGFGAPTVYADQANGGSGNLDWNDPDD